MSQRRVVVTGATGGLGKAIVSQLDALGHQTYLLARDQSKLDSLLGTLNHASGAVVDLETCEDFQQVVDAAVKTLGGLDGLVNNAGMVEPMGLLADLGIKEWESALRVNLTAPAQLMTAALPALRSSAGRIVNISSGAAVKPTAGWGAYCTAKAGLLHLGRVVAAEEPTVSCFSLRPGVIDTDMQREIRESAGMREEEKRRFLELHREGKLEQPEVPARAAVWLVLHGPLNRTGELIEYTDSEVVEGIGQLFPSS